MAFKKILCGCSLLFLGLISTPAHSGTDLQALSLNVTKGFIIPAYEQLNVDSQSQSSAWDNFCAEPDLAKKVLVEKFNKVNDSWQIIQHMTFGPITSFLRKDRLYHWPERRNAVSRALGKVMGPKDKAVLMPEKFASSSVAIQGLPALERVLFDATFDLKDPFTCQLGRAISKNIAKITKGTLEDWTKSQENVLTFLEKGQAHPIYFASMDEISNRYFTLFLTGFQIITDQKLLSVLGSSLDKAKPKRAEFWRSGRPVQNIIQNTKGIQSMGISLAKSLPSEHAESTAKLLSRFVKEAEKLPSDLGLAVQNAADREKVIAFKEFAKSTRSKLIDIFTTHAGLTVGFNSLDGD